MSQATEDGSEVIGYELELPWMQDLFGPTSTRRQRVCLPCYGSIGGVREQTLTRQGVEAGLYEEASRNEPETPAASAR